MDLFGNSSKASEFYSLTGNDPASLRDNIQILWFRALFYASPLIISRVLRKMVVDHTEIRHRDKPFCPQKIWFVEQLHLARGNCMKFLPARDLLIHHDVSCLHLIPWRVGLRSFIFKGQGNFAAGLKAVNEVFLTQELDLFRITGSG